MDQAIASASRRDGQPLLEASLIRELMGTLPNATLERLFGIIAQGESAPLMHELDRLLTSGNSPVAIARQMVRYLRNTLMASLGGENTTLLQIAAEERARAARTAQLFSEEELTRNLQLLLRTFDDLNFRQEQRFHLELGLLRLVHAQRLLPMEQILSTLTSLPTKAGLPAPRSTSSVSSASSASSGSTSRPPSAPYPSSAPDASQSPSPFASSGSSPVLSTVVLSSSARVSPMSHSSDAYAEPTRIDTGNAEFSETEGALARAIGPHLVPRSVPEPAAPSVSAAASGSIATMQAVANSAALTDTPSSSVQPTSAAEFSLEAARAAVVQALEAGGHSSAASLLDAGQWILDGASLRIEVPTKATMIRITFNAAAEKLVRQGLAQSGAPTRYRIVPGESSVAITPRAASAGSIDQEARNHPLVVQSLEIFDGEICSVIDLRPK
jgi:DNA polymerase-3 subunit gamma/tau